MNRRRFLGMIAGLLGAGFAPTLACTESEQGSAKVAADPEALRAFFANASSAAGVGRAYLRMAPQEADVETLQRLLLERLPPLRAADRDAVVRDLLVRQHQRDLLEGRTVRLDGWILSETEARLSALAALSGEARRG